MEYVALVEGDPCWHWIGQKSYNGYGRFWTGERQEMAHRWIFERLVGPIPEGHVIDHVYARGCRSRDCVNPGHLEAVTDSENARRGATASRTECPSGHPYNEANTRWYQGRRYCRACNRGGGEGRETVGSRGGVPLSSNSRRKVMRAKEILRL